MWRFPLLALSMFLFLLAFPSYSPSPWPPRFIPPLRHFVSDARPAYCQLRITSEKRKDNCEKESVHAALILSVNTVFCLARFSAFRKTCICFVPQSPACFAHVASPLDRRRERANHASQTCSCASGEFELRCVFILSCPRVSVILRYPSFLRFLVPSLKHSFISVMHPAHHVYRRKSDTHAR